MQKKFNFETELVDKFIDNYFKNKNKIVVKEMPIRVGNIDIISINDIELPFSKEQIKVLSKPSAAIIFSKIKNVRPISKRKILSSVGLSENTVNNVLYELQNCNLIVKKEKSYYRSINYEFPKTIITGYEAKLTDFNKAFYQAKINKEFVDYSYLVFPMEVANNLSIKYNDILINNDIGLIGVSDTNYKVFIKANKVTSIKDHIRLLNVAKANLYAYNF